MPLTIAWGPCPPVDAIVGAGIARLWRLNYGTIKATDEWPSKYLGSDEDSLPGGCINIDSGWRVDDVPTGR